VPQLIRRLETKTKGEERRAGDARRFDGVSASRFRHPGHEQLRAVVRDVVVTAGVLDEGEALTLVSHGLAAVARRAGVSERTLRRRFADAGTSVSRVVHRTRVETTVRACGAAVPTTVVARWLGFTNTDAYRRFVKRELGLSIKRLRPRVRESAIFFAPID
jgi:AraC-like DNA-binding protein